MTYPPQPGQPGQPDPYGQQPPQSGGFPQQPYPQQGGWDPNQQQPYPTQQYPQGWDPGQQQYQQPGSGGTAAWGDPNAQQQGWADPNAQQYGQQAWNPNTGGQMSGWDTGQGGYQQGFGGPPAPPKQSKTGMWIAIGAVVVLVLAGLGITGFVAPGFFLSKDDNTTAAPTSSTSARPTAPKTTARRPTTSATRPSTSSGAGEGAAVIKNFVTKLNSGDTAGAVQLGCVDSRSLLQQSIGLIKPPYQLQVADVPDDKYLVRADVSGTAGGENVDGFVSAKNFDGKGFCISVMLVT